MEKRGIAYCASEFSPHEQRERQVYAGAVFSPGNTAQEQLPLTELYEHPDHIDLISAQEFGLEGLFPGRFLLCLPVSQTPEALDEMEALIVGTHAEKVLCAEAWQEGSELCLRDAAGTLRLALSDSAGELLGALARLGAGREACLAAVCQWCVGYPLRLYLPKELLS